MPASRRPAITSPKRSISAGMPAVTSSMLRYDRRPVAAGMSLPMMTFSLRPRSSSTLPSRAASVSTLVVSWKEAADRKLSVASEALVMPRMISSQVAGSPPFATTSLVLLVEDQAVDHASGQEAGVAGGLDQDLLGHLADDELHVLVVDLHALLVVDVLDLAHDVAGGLQGSPVLEQLVRVERALVELVARLHLLAVLDHEVGPAADGVAVHLLAGVVEDDHLLGLVRPPRCGPVPANWVIFACPLGLRASNSSTTRGRPWVMSAPATPPVWKVRMVSWVPGSPMDCAAMWPTASPMATRSLAASERP